MTIYAGKLRHRVTIQQRSQVPDTYGQPKDEWQSVGRAWCLIEPLSGSESVASGAVEGVLTHRVTMRWGVKVDAAMRLLWLARGKTRIFQVVSVPSIEERNRELLLLCKESDAESQTLEA